MKKAYFAGGCFWCTEALFERVKGVNNVVSVYANGKVKNPSYEDVSSGETNAAEAVEIEYDENVISYKELLEIFFKTHNPTTLNRQGADVGTQYRSGVYFVTEKEKNIAEQVIKDFESKKIFDNPIVTEVKELENFYIAEDYHQDFYKKNPNQGYCQAVIDPKLGKLRAELKEYLRD